MGLSISNVFTPATQAQYLQTLLNAANTLGLPTTAWQPGGVSRTILAVLSSVLAANDQIVSTMAQGGFLDFAAGVTVDPSVTPTATPGWLDILADSTYNVQRIGATYAANSVILTNTSGSSYGPYVAGTYHVANPATGATYTNTASVTINAATLVGSGVSTTTGASVLIKVTTVGAHGRATGDYVTIAGVVGNTAANGTWQITVVDATNFTLNGSTGNGAYASGGTINLAQAVAVSADVAGAAGTSAPGTITVTTTTNVGVTVTNLVSLTGSAAESNAALVARCRAKLGSLSPNGPSGAYKYFALTSSQLLGKTSDATATPVTLAGGAITRALVQANKVTGTVTTYVANAGGVVSGVSNLAVSGATNASPIEITTASNHGLSTGAFTTISGVGGNTAANGTWQITVTAANKFTLTGSAGNAAYTSGGVVEGGDLGEVDAVIQANAVPLGVTALTASAVAQNVAIVCDIWVPLASASSIAATVTTALTNYINALPIGGLSDPNGAYTNVLPFDAVLGVIFVASAVVQQATLTLNGATLNVAVGTTSVAVISPAIVVNVHGV